MKNFLKFVAYGAGTCLGINLMQKAIEMAKNPVNKAKLKRKVREILKTEDEI